MHRFRLWVVVAVLAFSGAGCPSEPDEYEPVPAPDDDDDVSFRFTGQVVDWSTDEAISGMDVSVGQAVDTTDLQGRYSIEIPDSAPQQVDFYESPTSVTTYADCEREHDHEVYSSNSRRGGDEVDIRVRLDGFTDAGTISGSWARRIGSSTWLESVTAVAPQQDDDGSWFITLRTEPAQAWWLALSELDVGVIVWGMGSGGVIGEVEDEVLELTLSTDDLVPGTWDGAVDPVVTSVTARQVVGSVTEWTPLYVPILDSVATGQPADLWVVDTGSPLDLQIGVQRSDQSGCDWHSQTFDVSLPSPDEPVHVPDLFDIPRIFSATPGEVWTYRPELAWTGLPDDPQGSTSGYFYVFPPNGSAYTSWTLYPDPICSPETATWPVQLDTVQAESTGWVFASYYGGDRRASCSSMIEWMPL